jgi:poly-gamma-glutamate capsule biosynthesis protein CapA/YwtB (metallophosphatase superfamily)
MKRQASWCCLGLFAIMLTACLNVSPITSPASPLPSPKHIESAETSSPITSQLLTTVALPVKPERSEATLLAVGDIMVHMPQLSAYYDDDSKRYNLTPWFAQVKPIFLGADWVIGNLETPIAGKDLKYSGFPRFNAPQEIAEALTDAGFDLVSTANNHSMDRGFPGVQRTLTNIWKAGLIPVGTAESAEQQKKSIIVERNGIRMGFLAYTYGTNGIPVPPDKAFAVNLIDLPAIQADIARLRKAKADIVTVSLHFGLEYQRLPSDKQTQMARDIIKAGADIILGAHSHVVQPYEEIEIPASESYDGAPHRGIVIYSLGNFISNQTGSWKDVGLIFGVHLVKTRLQDGTYSTQWDKITTEATWVHIFTKNHKRYYTIIPMKSALATRDIPDLSAKDYAKMNTLLSGINKHLLMLQSQ